MSDAGDRPEAGRKGGGKKKIIIAGLAVLIAAGAGGGAWFGGLLHHHPAATGPGAVAVEKPVLIDLPDMVSNLDTGGHRASFIKLHAKLQARNAADATVLQSNIPQLLDIFQTYLRATRPDELHGLEGTYRLREALMNRIDATFAPLQVSDLLFTQILVQ